MNVHILAHFVDPVQITQSNFRPIARGGETIPSRKFVCGREIAVCPVAMAVGKPVASTEYTSSIYIP